MSAERKGFRRIVVKIGTNAMMEGSRVNRKIIGALAEELSALRKKGVQVILVSSGAIGCAIEKLGLDFPKETVMQQAMAAIGQNTLMHEYEKAFAKHNQVIAQLLLTHYNFSNKNSLHDLKNSVEKIIELGAIPVINENDPVSFEALSEEKSFSDNDGLAALAAINFGADLMVILTDVDGIFTDNPKHNHKAEKIQGLKQLLEESIVAGEKSKYGLGGIKSKILAVKMALENNCSAAVCRARAGAVTDVVGNGGTGSFFGRERDG
ncbi:MAG TPA: glutamate 5-kinase [archaeon]|nr:glutamate 5-kinase [archaeon]